MPLTPRFTAQAERTLISAKVIEAMDAADTTFHGAGREDIDALMLGDGRPFVLEVNEPGKRTTDLKRLKQEINVYCEGKVAVSDLRFVDHQTVRNLKGARHDKVYLATISCAGVDRDTLILGLRCALPCSNRSQGILRLSESSVKQDYM